MKIIEFRIPMPMSVEDYCRCQLYAVIKGSKNEVDKGSGLHIVKNEIHSDENFTGRLTQKDLYLAGILPNWLQSLLDPKFTILTEMSYNSYPHTKTYYSNCALSSLIFSIESNHIDGVVTDSNPLNLSDEQLNSRKIVNLDIATDGKIPPEENLTSIQLKNSTLLPLPKDWIKRSMDGEELPFKVMTCVKLVTLSVPYFGILGSKVENFIMNTLKEQFTSYHRRVLTWADDWENLTMENLREMESDIFAKINEQFYKTYGKHFTKDESVEEEEEGDVEGEEIEGEGQKINLEDHSPEDVIFPDSQSTETYTGYLYKLGGVFFNATWNMRYIVLCKNILYYYDGKDDNKPKDTLNLTGSKIQWIGEYYGRSFAFAIHPTVHNPIYLSADTEESAKKWILILQLRSEVIEEESPTERRDASPHHSPSPLNNNINNKIISNKRDNINLVCKENGLTLSSPLHRAVIRLVNVERVRPSFQGVVSSSLNWYDRLFWFISLFILKYLYTASKYFQYRYSLVFLIKPKIFLCYLILTCICHLSRLSKRIVNEILTVNKTSNFTLIDNPNDYIISLGNTSETFENLERVLADKTFNHVSQVNLFKLIFNDRLYNIFKRYTPSPITFKTLSQVIKLDPKTLFVTTQIDNGSVRIFTREYMEELFDFSKTSQIDVSDLEFNPNNMDFDELIKNIRNAEMDKSPFFTGNISLGYELILIRAAKRGCRIALYSDFQPTTFPEFLFSKYFQTHRVIPNLQFVHN